MTSNTEKQAANLQTYLAALFFLSKEAKRDGLPIIKTIFDNAIEHINIFIHQSDDKEVYANIIKVELVAVMELLDKFSTLSAEERIICCTELEDFINDEEVVVN